MAARYQRERVHDLWDELAPLLIAHHAEIAHFPDIALDPDVARYCRLEDTGVLRVYTARVDGALVGYTGFVVGTNAHYQGSLQAKQDVFFVHPGRRGALLGRGLIRFADAALAAEGVQVVYHHTKLAHPTLARLLAAEGYEAVDLVLAKRLDPHG